MKTGEDAAKEKSDSRNTKEEKEWRLWREKKKKREQSKRGKTEGRGRWKSGELSRGLRPWEEKQREKWKLRRGTKGKSKERAADKGWSRWKKSSGRGKIFWKKKREAEAAPVFSPCFSFAHCRPPQISSLPHAICRCLTARNLHRNHRSREGRSRGHSEELQAEARGKGRDQSLSSTASPFAPLPWMIWAATATEVSNSPSCHNLIECPSPSLPSRCCESSSPFQILVLFKLRPIKLSEENGLLSLLCWLCANLSLHDFCVDWGWTSLCFWLILGWL